MSERVPDPMPDFEDDRQRVEAELGEMSDFDPESPHNQKAKEAHLAQMAELSDIEEGIVLRRIAEGETPQQILNFYAIEGEKNHEEARKVLGDKVVDYLLERDKKVKGEQDRVAEEVKAGRPREEILKDLGGPENAWLKIGKDFTDELLEKDPIDDIENQFAKEKEK